MASIYSLEPITHGKVILKTSFGEVEIELWPREAPRAVRNFLQHIVDGYYTGTIFHRVVPEFIIQGGDPTGTGYGGESVYDGGKPFPAEFNQRLRFSHRGIVAMAGADKDDNRSQFFITLAACPELDKNHTIFGKVTGNTIFNVLEASKLELSKDDPERPVHPPQILGADIVVNPFEDMAPNPAAVAAIAARNNAAAAARTKAAAKTRPGRAGIARRNNALLSFADNDGNEDEDDPLKPGAQKKFKMTAPPNFVKRKQKERGDVEIKRIEKIEKVERVERAEKVERIERVEEPKVASVQVRDDNEDEVKPKKEVKDKVFKLVMKEQKEETIYDFGPKEKKRRKRINDDDVLGKLMSFKQNKAYDDLKAHKLNFKSAPDDSEEQQQQQQQE